MDTLLYFDVNFYVVTCICCCYFRIYYEICYYFQRKSFQAAVFHHKLQAVVDKEKTAGILMYCKDF